MRSVHFLAAIALLANVALADPPLGYYDPALGRTGTELRNALHSIVRNHRVVPYSSTTRFNTSDALKTLDQDPLNATNIIGIYSRASEPQSDFGLTTGWNREHLWPDSYGLDGQEPAYSDLHNLRAEDATVNSSRGNKFFDVSDIFETRYRLPAHAEAPLASTDSDSWEPPAEVRGDIARALFYMAVRYTGDVVEEPELRLTDATSEITSATNVMGRLSTLLRWSQADPVDDSERLRNQRVYSYQDNRNPFVDRPEWVAGAFVPVLHLTHVGSTVVLAWTNDPLAMVAEQISANLVNLGGSYERTGAHRNQHVDSDATRRARGSFFPLTT